MDVYELETKLNDKLHEKSNHSDDETIVNFMYNFANCCGKTETAMVLGEGFANLFNILSKISRHKKNSDCIELLEGIADVEIYLDQIKYIYGLNEKSIEYVKDIKRENILNEVKKGNF